MASNVTLRFREGRKSDSSPIVGTYRRSSHEAADSWRTKRLGRFVLALRIARLEGGAPGNDLTHDLQAGDCSVTVPARRSASLDLPSRSRVVPRRYASSPPGVRSSRSGLWLEHGLISGQCSTRGAGDAAAKTASECAPKERGVAQVPTKEGDGIDDQLARALVVVEHVEPVTSLVVDD